VVRAAIAMDYCVEEARHISPALAPLGRLLEHLRENGRIRPISYERSSS